VRRPRAEQRLGRVGQGVAVQAKQGVAVRGEHLDGGEGDRGDEGVGDEEVVLEVVGHRRCPARGAGRWSPRQRSPSSALRRRVRRPGSPGRRSPPRGGGRAEEHPQRDQGGQTGREHCAPLVTNRRTGRGTVAPLSRHPVLTRAGQGTARRPGRRPGGAALEQVGPPLVANAEAPAAEQPRQRSARPPSGAARAARGVDPAPGDARGDAASPEGASQGRGVVRLVGVQLGRALPGRPGFPRGPMIGGMASTSGRSWVESWALAAERRTASGMPFRSTTRWYLEPGLPRSVGLGPVCSPPFWPGR
jgi:hypothetical protein